MRRLLVFFVLLAAGLLALKVAIGDEQAVRANGNAKESPAPQNPRQPGVRMNQGDLGATVSQRGSLRIPNRREVPQPDGSVKKQLVYELLAKDSQPIGEGLQQLTDVSLDLYDDGVHTATVTARQAFLELGTDANGDPVVTEQKAIDLRDTVFAGEPNGKMAGVRLTLGDARINIGDNELQLTTLPEQPVKLTIVGERTVELTGRGANARMPRNQHGGLRRADIEILRDPLLVTDDVTVRAAGRMHYVEDTVTGAAQITLEDDVQLDLARTAFTLPGVAARTSGARSRVHGDQFTGWLRRTGDGRGNHDARRRSTMQWQRLQLLGAPARIEMPGVQVETPRLTVRPGPLGDPFAVTAHGGESRIEQTELRPDSGQKEPAIGVSPRRIHLLRPGDSVGALHRRMGFPLWTLRALDQQQIVVFEGASRIESGTRTFRASDGIVVVRRATGDTGVLVGIGAVELRDRGLRQKDGRSAPELVATGNDGLLLTVGDDFERLRLGPPRDERSVRWREHTYSVRHGTAHVLGRGTCTVTNDPSGTTLALRAPFDEIEAGFGEPQTSLRNVRQLHAKLVDDTLTELDVGGLPVRVTLMQGGENLLAQAPRLLQVGPRSLRLLPMEREEAPWSELSPQNRTPRLLRSWTTPAENTIEVVGPRIDVHHVGGRNALVDAHAVGEDLPRIYAKMPPRPDREATTITCAARRLRVLPFVLTPEIQRLHFARGPLAFATLHALAKPWLLVDDVDDFQLDDAEQGHIEGFGHRLLISQGGRAALFVGDPREQNPAVVRRTHDGRTIALQGARVRVLHDGSGRLSALGAFAGHSTFLAPTMTLHEPGAHGLLSHMRAVCRGNIDVEPEAVRFGGPVEAVGILPDGSADPDGLYIDADSLSMTRRASTGMLTRVEGTDVLVNWTRLDARARNVVLDLLDKRCVASDPNGAVVTMPDGRVWRSSHIAVNYATWSVNMGPGSAVQHSPLRGDREGER
ncbi:MAG TPA: hypothetical protein ENI87_06690 [bacterium]|nr:hypothetical protein [bacterium]